MGLAGRVGVTPEVLAITPTRSMEGAGRGGLNFTFQRKYFKLFLRPWRPFRSLVVVFVVGNTGERFKGCLPSDGREGGGDGGGRKSLKILIKMMPKHLDVLTDLAGGLLVLADHVVRRVVDAAAAEHEAVHAHP